MPEPEPSKTLGAQRLRNRIMEVLELAGSFEEQAEYQESVSFVSVPNEVINQWEDWVHPPIQENYCEPVFSEQEQRAIQEFHEVWNAVADATPNPLPSLQVTQRLDEWERLRSSAISAMEVFTIRGRFPEDEELF